MAAETVRRLLCTGPFGSNPVTLIGRSKSWITKELEPIAHWSACESRSVLVSTTRVSIEPSVQKTDRELRGGHCPAFFFAAERVRAALVLFVVAGADLMALLGSGSGEASVELVDSSSAAVCCFVS